MERYDAEARVRHFGCRQQLIARAFAQLTWCEGLRNIADCLNAKPGALYRLGFREAVAKSTLADANEQGDWRLLEDLAHGLIAKAHALYAGENLGLDIDNTVYAVDSTTIDLSLTLFPWIDFRETKAGINMHTQIDLRGPGRSLSPGPRTTCVSPGSPPNPSITPPGCAAISLEGPPIQNPGATLEL